MAIFFFHLFSRLPFWIFYLISDLLYGLLAYVVRYRSQTIALNLKRSFPEKSAQERKKITRDFYRNFADLLVETIKLPDLSVQDLRQRVTFTNAELVQPYLRQGSPVLIMASHQCNWEWAPSATVVNGMPADAVYKPLYNPLSERLVHTIRASFGARPIPMHRLLRDMASRRSEPRLVALVADQIPDTPERGYWTNFLHQDTPFYPGTERLARTFKLPVYFVEMQRVRRGHYTLTFHPVAQPPYQNLPEGAILDRYRDLLEQSIRRAPADWLWSHKRWKHQRDKYEKIEVKF